MKNCKKIATLLLAAALLVGFASPDHAGARAPREQAQWLESLSAGQRASAQKIMEGKAAHMRALRQALEAKRSELAGLRRSRNPDTGAIERLYAEIGSIRGKMLACRAGIKAELRAAGLPVERMRKGLPDELKEKGPGKRAPRLNDELGAEQKAAAQAILDQHMAEIGSAREALAAKNAALAEAMAAERPDAAKIERISREIGEIRGQVAVKRVELRKKFAEAGLPENTLDKRPVKGKPGKAGKASREDGAPAMKDRAPLEPAAESQKK